MTIKQALKQKNKLIKQIAENTKLMQQYNSVEVGNQRPYSMFDLLDKIIQDTSDLSSVKAKLHTANAPVLEKIFWMAEMKSMISSLKKWTVPKVNQTRIVIEWKVNWY